MIYPDTNLTGGLARSKFPCPFCPLLVHLSANGRFVRSWLFCPKMTHLFAPCSLLVRTMFAIRSPRGEGQANKKRTWYGQGDNKVPVKYHSGRRHSPTPRAALIVFYQR